MRSGFGILARGRNVVCDAGGQHAALHGFFLIKRRGKTVCAAARIISFLIKAIQQLELDSE
jgi:hypothetical protein